MKQEMRTTITSMKLVAGLTLLCLLAGVALADVAVVVHKNCVVSDIPQHELKRIYLGKRIALGDGPNVTLSGTSDLREEFYRLALDLSVQQVRRHWIKTVFAGGRVSPPELLDEPAAVLDFVAGNSGAIAFIDETDVDDRVKVLTIDGHRPGHGEYPLGTE